jgi:hypothetical protein
MNGQNGFFFGRSPVREHGVLHQNMKTKGQEFLPEIPALDFMAEIL